MNLFFSLNKKECCYFALNGWKLISKYNINYINVESRKHVSITLMVISARVDLSVYLTRDRQICLSSLYCCELRNKDESCHLAAKVGEQKVGVGTLLSTTKILLGQKWITSVNYLRILRITPTTLHVLIHLVVIIMLFWCS